MNKARYLIAAEGFAAFGSAMMTTTLLLWLVVESGQDAATQPALVATFLTVVSLTIVIVGPIVGTKVDQLPKLGTMVWADIGRAAIVVALIGATLIARQPQYVTLSLVLIFILVAFSSSLTCLFVPARSVTVSKICDDKDLETVFSRLNIASTLAGFAAPSIAALLVTNGFYLVAMGVQLVCFVASFAMVMALRASLRQSPDATDVLVSLAGSHVSGASRSSTVTEIVAGGRLFLASPALVLLLICACMETITSSAFNVLNIFYFNQTLGVGAHWFGYYESAELIGILLGSLLAVPLTRRFAASKCFVTAVLTSGILCVAYAILQVPVVALIMGLAIGTALGVVNATFNPMFIRNSKPERLGQMVSTFTVVSAACTAVSTMTWGLLSATAFNSFKDTSNAITVDGTSLLLIIASAGLLAAGLFAVTRRGVLVTAASSEDPSVTLVSVTDGPDESAIKVADSQPTGAQAGW